MHTPPERDESDLAAQLPRPGDPGSPRVAALAGALLLSCYVALAVTYRDAIPLFEAPDEPAHLHYAVFVHNHGRSPRQEPLEVPGEGMQPPLVYWLTAPLLRGTGLDLHWVEQILNRVGRRLYLLEPQTVRSYAISVWMRGKRMIYTDGRLAPLGVARHTSLVFGAVAVTGTFAAVWRLRRDACAALLAGSLLAFNPQFLFVSGYFTNDPAAAAIGAGSLWVVFDALRDPQRGPSRGHYLACALLSTLGILTKLSTPPGLAVAAATVIAVDRRASRAKLRDVALAAGLVLLSSAPYAIWAAEHRGGFLGADAVLASAAGMPTADAMWGLATFLTTIYWKDTFDSYWACFGWVSVHPPRPARLAFLALTAIGVLGLFVRRARNPADPLRSRSVLAYLSTAVVVTIAAHFAMNVVIMSPQGRHLFASAPQIAVLLALGMLRLFDDARWRLPLALAVIAILIALDLYCLHAALIPAYEPIQS